VAADSFSLALRDFAEKANAKVHTVVTKFSQDILARVVNRTPVGNPSLWKSKPPAGYVGGRLRANWTVGLGGPDLSTNQPPSAAASAVSRGSAVIAKWQGQDIYLMNSMPYVREIEYEGHSAIQAPAGMVRVTVAEAQAVLAENVREVPK
jgi:hypothetical protein